MIEADWSDVVTSKECLGECHQPPEAGERHGIDSTQSHLKEPTLLTL